MSDQPVQKQEILSADEALHRAVSLREQRRFAEAEHLVRDIIRRKPDNFDALHLLGVVLLQQGKNQEGIASLDSALSINPTSPDLLFNRGVALGKLNRPDEAVTSFDAALAFKPNYFEALYHRGEALRILKRPLEAIASYEKAIAINPDYAEGVFGYGHALGQLNRLEEALTIYKRAVGLKPDDAGGHKILGDLLKDLGKVDEAIESYEKAIALDPSYAEVKFALCHAQLPIIYADESEISARRAKYQERLRALYDEFNRKKPPRNLINGIGSTQPFYLAYQGCNDRDIQAIYGSLVCQVMAEKYPPATYSPPPKPHESIRVGIISGFFRQHSNWKIPIKGWLTQLNRSRFQIFGYHTGTEKDAETDVAASYCDRFVQGPMSVDRWRHAILEDAPHALIYPEIGMDRMACQLAAQRLAPVQCNSWGHPETSGFPTIDYFLTSDLMEPIDGQTHYTEQLVSLPNLSIYYEPLDVRPEPISRATLGLKSSAFVYCCCQSIFKYLPQYDQILPRIAREVRNCQFVFIQYPKGKHVNTMFLKRLDRAFSAFGMRAADYCVVLPPLDASRFLATIGHCDIFLDSVGWSGCNSTLESLVYNLPIVTMAGSSMRGRHTMAILKMMSVAETIAETLDDYVSIAVRLARDEPWRMALKAKISAAKHLIYFDSACIMGLEQFLNSVVRENAPLIRGRCIDRLNRQCIADIGRNWR